VTALVGERIRDGSHDVMCYTTTMTSDLHCDAGQGSEEFVLSLSFDTTAELQTTGCNGSVIPAWPLGLLILLLVNYANAYPGL
jgi:hypothetical protein